MSSTVPCQYHLRPGGCSRGNSCRFSHSNRSDGSPKQPLYNSSSFSNSRHFGVSSTKASDVFGACKFFAQGRCTQGTTCPFPHVAVPVTQIEKRHDYKEASPHNLAKNFALGPCKFYIQGVCSKGNACPFPHPITTPPPDLCTTKIPCDFFLQGVCKRGDSCTFVHDRHKSVVPYESAISEGFSTDGASLVIRGQKVDPFDSKPLLESVDAFSPAGGEKNNLTISDETFDHKMFSCKVAFGNGAAVQSITTSFESRSVLLSNLPTPVTQSELIDLLEPFGDLESVLIDDTSGTACAKFSSIPHASAAVQGLHNARFKDNTILAKMDLKAVESGEAILRSTKVKVSWFSPTRVAWAHYKTIFEARRHAQRLMGASFNDRPIVASFQPPSLRQTRSFSVEIKGLPPDVELQNLKKFCSTQSVTLGEFFYDRQSSLRDIEGLLRQYGTLDAFEAMPADSKKPKITAFAQFADAEHAAEAVKQLHNKPLQFLHRTPVWLENIHSVKYAIPFPHFSAIKGSLGRLRDDCKDCKLRFYDRDEAGRPVDDVCIRVFGTDPKSLGRVKSLLESLLRGSQLLNDTGKVVWDDFFITGLGATFLAEVGKETDTFIKCDPRQRSLRIFGEHADIGPSEQAICQKIGELEAGEHIIALDRSMIRMLMRGGLRQLEQLMGADKLTVNVVARTLTVRSDDTDIERVKVTLAMQGRLPSSYNATDVSCPVCYCEVTDQTLLPCGHSYCRDCLQHLLQAAAESTLPSLKCVYEVNGKPCGTPIPNTIIRTLLSPDQEARLYEASFLAYIHSRTSEFKYCPTPDCRVIYRPAEAVLRCPSCLDRICASCHVLFHEGLSCSERRDNLDSGNDGFKRWKEENGVRPCPGCKADLQKNGGCNHMHCSMCGTHICWVCMKTFGEEDTEGGVYGHMRKAHGGFQ